ncbi:radical SAM protein [Sandarakinorhabdus sp.]|uniref:radical SAM protein n=1 Tax=Sandarakinorhabdus sp. TaxID=1916663 RepID=UPI00286EA537|nr:radical SAM protein [Sandarakinorhabdus sp.]
MRATLHPGAFAITAASPFAVGAKPLDPAKFRDPLLTAKGEARASVTLGGLTTLWFNTGTLCNLACRGCYIESSPTNDALVYLTLADLTLYLDEIARDGLPVREIGFTGGEPFMNRDFPAMIALVQQRGFDVLVLTNAMRPLRRFEAEVGKLSRERLTFRISLDHFSAAIHDAERGDGSFAIALDGIRWLAGQGFAIAIAGRHLAGESEAAATAGYAALFAGQGLPCPPLVLFPEMDASADVPEITTACWGILDVSPASIMCASSRMVVRRRGADRPAVLACTLLAYDPQFELGTTLAEASRPVALNHPHCARFCVLGGASCSG